MVHLSTFNFRMNLDRLLPKVLKYRMLAQCDGQVVRELVEHEGREAMTVVPLMTAVKFEKYLKNNSEARQIHTFFHQAYSQLGEDFKIVHDKFGGYCLKYVGDKIIRAGVVFREAPVGLLAPAGTNPSPLSVISKTSTGANFLMLGTIRFVNSDCNPNCEYDFSSFHNIVKLRSKKVIKKNDELTVDYGSQFFGTCRCYTCELKALKEKELAEICEIAAPIVLTDAVTELCWVLVEEVIVAEKDIKIWRK